MQYHLIVCIDRSEYLDPRAFGDGRKLRELSRPGSFVTCALSWLVAGDNGRGAGDIPAHPLVGRWAATRIVIAGDYGSPGVDLPDNWQEQWGTDHEHTDEPPNLYGYIQAFGVNISHAATQMLAAEPELLSLADKTGRKDLLCPGAYLHSCMKVLEEQGSCPDIDPHDTSMFEVDE